MQRYCCIYWVEYHVPMKHRCCVAMFQDLYSHPHSEVRVSVLSEKHYDRKLYKYVPRTDW